MSEVEDYPNTLESVIHKIFHDIADRHNLDVDLVSEIIAEYNDFMSQHLTGKVIINEN